MYAITGVTGHVGGAVARDLLAAGASVRAVVRDQEKGRAWAELGAEIAVADFADRTALAAAFAGCRGAFVMLPTIPTATDADHRALADSIAAAVAGSGVSHVAMLSSIGADLPEGTGPIRWLYHLESRLRDTGTVLTAIRSPHFQEKVETVLGAATGAGVPASLAAELVELYDTENRGLLQPRGDRRRPCTTALDETVRQIVHTAVT
jgi:uncharacterized protein YbjT (DUF2867 family)